MTECWINVYDTKGLMGAFEYSRRQHAIEGAEKTCRVLKIKLLYRIHVKLKPCAKN